MPRNRPRKRKKRQSEESLASVPKATLEVAVQHQASPWLRDYLAQKFHWHTLFIRTMEAASSIAHRDIRPDVFNTYLILGARWFSHHESVEALLANGRYGDSMVLLRSLLEDTDLMTYFSFYPEEASDWNERLSQEPVWPDKVYRQSIQKFGMRHIWQMLKEKGIEPLGERDYSILSAVVHASPWGARFYGRTFPGDPDRLHLNLAPLYDAAASFSIALVLQGTYPRPIEAFLTACDPSTDGKAEWRSIKAGYDSLIEGWQAKMQFDSWFRDAMGTVEESVSQGEESETILRDLRKRFEETYGQAVNPTVTDTPNGEESP